MNDLLDSLEIILDCDPRNVNDKGVEQPTASGEKTPIRLLPRRARRRRPPSTPAASGIRQPEATSRKSTATKRSTLCPKKSGDGAGDRPG